MSFSQSKKPAKKTKLGRKLKHPQKKFKIRQYIASRSIFRLALDYIAINAAVAILLATALVFITGDSSQGINYIYFIYTELFGKEPSWSLPDRFMYQNIRAFLATLSLLSPSLFLGIIIYKFFVLKRDNIVFRSMCDVDEENGERFLNIHFYISSSLSLYNLRFTAFIRTYEKCRENASGKIYPMNTFPLTLNGDSFYPLPYNYVPSRFRIKIKENPMSISNSDNPSIVITEDQIIEVHTGDRKIRLDRKVGDFCELYVIAAGEVPDLQAQFSELKCYRIPEDVSPTPLPEMVTRFVRADNRFEVDNWQDFEGGKMNRLQRRKAKKAGSLTQQ
ncbi:hypothetical protein CWE08_05275 [Aliidiomarina iranensis]|uniref:Uncharacterized protein n=1 Tax=Aliidiomarina iranensis TaxID=1434071 RepID=A0A432W0N8_9GAMM|nr:hypothetical protein [Aliidiomarina iranensis]RUO22586.1 hypothetical protein CWE08_05275 [Aliidiomarina iranensis]